MKTNNIYKTMSYDANSKSLLHLANADHLFPSSIDIQKMSAKIPFPLLLDPMSRTHDASAICPLKNAGIRGHAMKRRESEEIWRRF